MRTGRTNTTDGKKLQKLRYENNKDKENYGDRKHTKNALGIPRDQTCAYGATITQPCKKNMAL